MSTSTERVLRNTIQVPAGYVYSSGWWDSVNIADERHSLSCLGWAACLPRTLGKSVTGLVAQRDTTEEKRREREW